MHKYIPIPTINKHGIPTVHEINRTKYYPTSNFATNVPLVRNLGVRLSFSNGNINVKETKL